MSEDSKTKVNWMRHLTLWGGLFIFFFLLWMPTPEGLDYSGQKVLAVTVLMGIWWMGETLPMPCTALLPLVLFPLLDVMSTTQVAPSYANHNIFLFMGGLFMAKAMARWSLDRRIAVNLTSYCGERPLFLLFGFMLTTGGLSMWLSDTATVMMMMPIGLAVIEHFRRKKECDEKMVSDFGAALMLGIAYSGVIGGIATLVGTPPNIIFAGQLESLLPEHNQVTFFSYMKLGTTVTFLLLPIAWFLLGKVFFKLSSEEIGVEEGSLSGKEQYEKLGPWSRGELVTAVVFTSAALLWLTRGSEGLEGGWGWSTYFAHSDKISDASIAIAASLVLFLWPSDASYQDTILDWEHAQSISWNVLLLFGGGFALAKAFTNSGLDLWVGEKLTVLEGFPLWALIGVTCFGMTFLTEFTSNTATTTILLPILASAGEQLGVDPALLMVAASMSASCAFMLPVATPGNAIVFGSGYLRIGQMARVGVVLNLIGISLITCCVYFFGPSIFTAPPITP